MSDYILCPNCHVRVRESHRRCPHCGGDLRRRIQLRSRRLLWWQAALLGAPLAALFAIYFPLDSAFIEYLLPLQFILLAAILSGAIYLLGNILAMLIHWLLYER